MKRVIPIVLLLAAACSDTTAPVSHSVELEPSAAEVFAGEALQFTAQVLPPDSNQNIRWQLAGPGTLTDQGLYRAPQFSGNVEDDLSATVSAASPRHGVSATARVTIPAAASLVEKGWDAFREGDDETAGVWFSRALDTFENYAPARAGFAWVDYRRGRVEDAVAGWEAAAQDGSTDALSGLILVHASRNEAGGIIDRGQELLTLDSDYVFLGDPGYSAGDVRWLMARAGLDTARYDVTAAQLDVLVPGHGLNPQAASFPEDALELLESIQGTV